MNKLTIIGNLTGDPELRTTNTGKEVCTFTVAVNRRKTANGQPDADFFRVSAWNGLAEICKKYLLKGKKVCIVGPVACRTYQANNGETRASLEVTADDVEFLSPSVTQAAPQPTVDQQTGYEQVKIGDELPF